MKTQISAMIASLVFASLALTSPAFALDGKACVSDLFKHLTGNSSPSKDVVIRGETEAGDECTLTVSANGAYYQSYIRVSLVDRSKIDPETNSIALGGAYDFVYSAKSRNFELDKCEFDSNGARVNARFIDDEIYSSTKRYELQTKFEADGSVTMGIYELGLLPWSREGFSCRF